MNFNIINFRMNFVLRKTVNFRKNVKLTCANFQFARSQSIYEYVKWSLKYYLDFFVWWRGGTGSNGTVHEYAIPSNCQTKRVSFWCLVGSPNPIHTVASRRCYVRCISTMLEYGGVLIEWTEGNQSQWEETAFSLGDPKRKPCKSLIMRARDGTELEGCHMSENRKSKAP